jgi:ribosome modulation factor
VPPAETAQDRRSRNFTSVGALPRLEERAVYDRTKILDEGMQAGLDDHPVESCPCPDGATKGNSLEGWRCATEDLSLPGVCDATLDLEKRAFLEPRQGNG